MPIFIKKLHQSGSTLGAFLYYYHIKFKENGYSYTFTATDEGMMYLAEAIERGDNTIVWVDNVDNGPKVGQDIYPKAQE